MFRLAVFLCALCAVSWGFLCLRIVTPGKWGGRPANCSSPLKAVQTGYVIVLHTAGSSCKTGAECNQQMTNIQHYHMNNKGWCNIAYNFLIGEDGKVYEGRGWNTEGAHTYGYNDISLGIAFIGDFTGRSPNAAAWIALKHLLHFAVENGYLSSDYLLMAHGDVSNTISPGQPIRNVLKMWPHYKH
ncbi:outer dense fiber protein 3B [Platysternon megacephalum]|uniref:Peptidoglycan-recognition protein n=1 Tax=Platysternon megacephalum TaxID=55544 RepID=A0A4D9DN43_9SAUR|nr:outer dense fiber protein 3B [Platysternon megacephalum]